MEMTPTDQFAVVQDSYQLEDWQAAASLLIDILRLPPVTARHQARKSRGFLGFNVPGALAERLRHACAERGIGVQLVPQSDVIPVIKPVRMHQVRITEEALCLGSTDLDSQTVLGWDTLRLIAVTKATKKESFQHWENTGYKEGTLKVTTYTEDYAQYLADVFAFQLNGQVLGVRLLSRELNYSQALGDAAPDALVDANARTDGFRLLISSIVARATQAFIPPESLALLGKSAWESGEAPVLDSLDAVNALNRWLLQRLRLHGAPKGGERKAD